MNLLLKDNFICFAIASAIDSPTVDNRKQNNGTIYNTLAENRTDRAVTENTF